VKPYYEQDGVTIYRGDCYSLLPVLPYGAVVTDPPYGTGWVRGGGAVGEFNAKHEQPEWDRWDTTWIGMARAQRFAVFCPTSKVELLRRPGAAVVHWRKTNPRPNGPDTEAVVLWPAALPLGLEWVGYNGDTEHHPCEKPLALMKWVLGFIPPELVILDPFMGSGTTLVAARELGRQAIGIDISPQYCHVAAKRLRQRVLPLEATA
jgi:hypothetical protein